MVEWFAFRSSSLRQILFQTVGIFIHPLKFGDSVWVCGLGFGYQNGDVPRLQCGSEQIQRQNYFQQCGMCDQQSLRSACAYARLSLHLSKCHIVGNHMSLLMCRYRCMIHFNCRAVRVSLYSNLVEWFAFRSCGPEANIA